MLTGGASPAANGRGLHRAAVLGHPVDHSLSPVLHRAAYRELGLRDWTYERYDVTADRLVDFVTALDDSWRGLSLTMPLKEPAFQVATQVGELADAVGAINTLVRTDAGWAGENTDVHGLIAALGEVGAHDLADLPPTVVVGSGATARSALAAIHRLGGREVVLMVRDEPRTLTVAQARRWGLELSVRPIGQWPDRLGVVVSTVPPAATAEAARRLPDGGSALVEVVYGEGPTALMAAAAHRGWAVVPGTAMLLHQGAEQVRLMTGRPAPVEAMRSALVAELAARSSHP